MSRVLIVGLTLLMVSACVDFTSVESSFCAARPEVCGTLADAGPVLPSAIAADCIAATGDLLELSGPGNEAIHPGSERLAPPNASFTATNPSTANAGFVVAVTDGGSESWTLDFESQVGALAAGGYVAAESTLGTLAPGEPGFDLSGDGNTCTQDYAKFTLYTVGFDSDGGLADFVAGFEQQCNSGDAPVLYGCLAYHAVALGNDAGTDGGSDAGPITGSFDGGGPFGLTDAGYLSLSCQTFDPTQVGYVGNIGDDVNPILAAYQLDAGDQPCATLVPTVSGDVSQIEVRPFDSQIVYLRNSRVYQFVPALFAYDAVAGWEAPDAGIRDIEIPTVSCDGGVGVGAFVISAQTSDVLYRCDDDSEVFYSSNESGAVVMSSSIILSQDQNGYFIYDDLGSGDVFVQAPNDGGQFDTTISWSENEVLGRSQPGGGFWVMLINTGTWSLGTVDETGLFNPIGEYPPSLLATPWTWALDSWGNLYQSGWFGDGDAGMVELTVSFDGGFPPMPVPVFLSPTAPIIDIVDTPPSLQPVLSVPSQPITGP